MAARRNPTSEDAEARAAEDRRVWLRMLLPFRAPAWGELQAVSRILAQRIADARLAATPAEKKRAYRDARRAVEAARSLLRSPRIRLPLGGRTRRRLARDLEDMSRQLNAMLRVMP